MRPISPLFPNPTWPTFFDDGQMATAIASAVHAAPAKKKAAAKRATISQSVSNYSCEGVDARLASNPMNGNSRVESRFSFSMQHNRNAGIVTIMGARGSSVIRSGRYPIFGSGGEYNISLNWIDGSNVSQTANLAFRADGSFTGYSTESGSDASPGYRAVCSILGSELCNLTTYSVSRSIEGVCWQK